MSSRSLLLHFFLRFSAVHHAEYFYRFSLIQQNFYVFSDSKMKDDF